jgi:hypothetical protein
MAEQWRLVREKGVWSATRTAPPARPRGRRTSASASRRTRSTSTASTAARTAFSAGSRGRGCTRGTRSPGSRGISRSASGSCARTRSGSVPARRRQVTDDRSCTLAREVQHRPAVGGHRSPAVHVEAVGEEQGRARTPPASGRVRAARTEASPARRARPREGPRRLEPPGHDRLAKVKDAGYRFVWIKAGEGDWHDPNFCVNVRRRRRRAEGRRLPLPAPEGRAERGAGGRVLHRPPQGSRARQGRPQARRRRRSDDPRRRGRDAPVRMGLHAGVHRAGHHPVLYTYPSFLGGDWGDEAWISCRCGSPTTTAR